MANYTAEELSFICKNPSCKSFGKSHPNCHCVQQMADGGEIKEFCQKAQPHDSSCSYHDIKSSIPQDMEPGHAVSGYLAKHGITGLINLSKEKNIKKYQSAIVDGHKDIDHYADSLFSSHAPSKTDYSKSHKIVDDWIDKGGIEDDIQNEIYKENGAPESFATGGQVKDSPSLYNSNLEDVHPAQNTLLQMAKSRISTHLNSQKALKNMEKLAFDPEPDQTEQKKSYIRARNIATNPLGIVNEIKRGTIVPEDVMHFNSMYPELSESLQKSLTSRISKAQLENEKPSRRIRQGLSLFLGAPLSGELKPQNIQAAQAVFQMNSLQPAQGAPSKGNSKKSMSSLSKSDQSFLTGNQALAARQQRQ